jgi:hypothetical protein
MSVEFGGAPWGYARGGDSLKGGLCAGLAYSWSSKLTQDHPRSFSLTLPLHEPREPGGL